MACFVLYHPLTNPDPCRSDIDVGGLIDDRAAWDMRLDSNDAPPTSASAPMNHVLYALNNSFAPPAGTRYRVEVGTWSALLWDLMLGRPNDCLVSAESARGPFPQVARERFARIEVYVMPLREACSTTRALIAR